MNSSKDEVTAEEVPSQKQIKWQSFRFHLDIPLHKIQQDSVQPQQVDGQFKRKYFRFYLDRPLHKWSLLPESKLIFIIRTSRRLSKSQEMSRTSKKLLQSLRLTLSFTGVFVKADESIMVILRKLKNHVTYGYPSLQSVKLLIHNLAAIKLDNKITILRGNPSLIEQAFGQYNISCIKDIVNEIANVGPHFKDVSKALFPFPFDKPKPRRLRDSTKKRHSDGGGAGNSEEHHINELLGKLKITS